MSNFRAIFVAVVFWLHDFVWRAKITAEKKIPSLIRVDVNKNFNLHMYSGIPLLLQNKLLIWRPLGYCELSVQSFNMLFSLLTAADFLYHQFWEFDSWSRQSLPFHDNYVIFNTLLLGNLLKEVKRNNMLITLELKKMSASFQNLPTLLPQKHTKFSTPSFTQCLSNVL